MLLSLTHGTKWSPASKTSGLIREPSCSARETALLTVYPKRRVRSGGRGSRGEQDCQHFTSSSLICVSRFTVIFIISTNDLAVT
ncbi:hypothetical protein Y032_0161g3395 [Ancylostoma ceylanicum]|uniref:Uncharacterized protein n=1 Tax=Ancylostoma ceylanicum TaxID=53326 RepID=A0A016SY61_9BILA|nr:hypothetical protein Y032_0161g3395 [Ancylostoma ceylanicum]